MAHNKMKRNLLNALKEHTACIIFKPDGTIVDASRLFLDVVGYSLPEIRGAHHRLFCSKEVADHPSYEAFWHTLAAGESRTGEFRRIHKKGDAIWLEATYIPVRGYRGRIVRVVKIANDVTEKHRHAADQLAVLESVDQSMARIEFLPTGHVVTANENFLHTMGYRLDDIVGKHHRIFCDDEFYREFPDFWQHLATNKFKNGTFKRVTRPGRPIWLEATYNPVVDEHGQVVKVVKFATDITRSVEHSQATRDAAESASDVARHTESIAGDGRQRLDEAADTARAAGVEIADIQKVIRSLSSQVSLINEVTDTIAGIARQTNMLSLNAAVESARAGENGRGFGVVAREIRALSDKSTQATDQIAEILGQNNYLIQQAATGIEAVVEKSGATSQEIDVTQRIFREILEGARGVSDAIRQLSSMETPTNGPTPGSLSHGASGG